MSIISIVNEFARSKNVELFYVGGYVRDKYLNISSSDIDIVPFKTDYEQFAFMLAKKLHSPAIQFKDNVRVVAKSAIIDVSKPRGSDIYEDLLKRDFTINNLAINLDGEMIGDVSDIDNKIIRMVSESSFIDDPLRILRTFRFQSTFGFTIEEATYTSIFKLYKSINNVAKERILEELKKLFLGKNFENALNSLIESGVLQAITGVDNFDKTAAKVRGFELQIARLINNIDNLNLSNNEVKLIKIFWQAEKDYLNNFDEKRFAYKYYNNIIDVMKFLSAKYVDKLDIIYDSLKLLNLEDIKQINGELLKEMGFTPGKQFKVILDDVHEKIALRELDLTTFQQYINTNYC